MANFLEERGDEIGAGLIGLGSYGAYKGTLGQLPQGGARRLLADQASNFLEGFYRPGADKQALYKEELNKAIRRSAKTLLNPIELATYKGTGVSSFLNDTILDMDDELKSVDDAYKRGEFGQSGENAIKRAKSIKNRIVKERHYKILNDSANTEIFDSSKSRLIENYRNRVYNKGKVNPWHKMGDAKDFIRSAGSKDIAQYALRTHVYGASELPGVGRLFKEKKLNLDTPNLKYLKWLDHSISGVMRGAQFTPRTYHLLATLKDNNMNLKEASDLAKTVPGVGNVKTMNGKLYFHFSPDIKSNFDWGGYSVATEWDPANRGKVRFIGTDLRDTPISTLTRGNHVINYVESKEYSISSLKEHVNKEPYTGPTRGKDIIPRTRRTNQQLLDSKTVGRYKNVAEGKLDSGGVYPQIKSDIKKISEGRERYKKGITAANFMKKARRLKVGGAAGAAIGAASIIIPKLIGDDEPSMYDEYLAEE
tara:strand:- start:1870 stop:3306 length:1437 start_codon:yes stop_codon:yes gene_type:complete